LFNAQGFPRDYVIDRMASDLHITRGAAVRTARPRKPRFRRCAGKDSRMSLASRQLDIGASSVSTDYDRRRPCWWAMYGHIASNLSHLAFAPPWRGWAFALRTDDRYRAGQHIAAFRQSRVSAGVTSGRPVLKSTVELALCAA
jgi:hypothetical protein